jgi:hypothetical protein
VEESTDMNSGTLVLALLVIILIFVVLFGFDAIG